MTNHPTPPTTCCDLCHQPPIRGGFCSRSPACPYSPTTGELLRTDSYGTELAPISESDGALHAYAGNALRVRAICHAYESGFGRGLSGHDLSQPYEPTSPEGIAYHEGWFTGRARLNDQKGQQPAEPTPICFCDEHYPDANQNATCGDCPRDYQQPAAQVRRFRGPGYLEQTGYIPKGSAEEREQQQPAAQVPRERLVDFSPNLMWAGFSETDEIVRASDYDALQQQLAAMEQARDEYRRQRDLMEQRWRMVSELNDENLRVREARTRRAEEAERQLAAANERIAQMERRDPYILSARKVIAEVADDLKRRHTVDGEWPEDDAHVKDEYDELVALAAALQEPTK